jgi:hypothetical protein
VIRLSAFGILKDMRRYISRKFTRTPTPQRPFSKNWELNIQKVDIQSCAPQEDPLGLCAVFHLEPAAWTQGQEKSYSVGASLLVQRLRQLEKAGYKAPMTAQAIALVEARLGRKLITITTQDILTSDDLLKV